MEEAIRHVRGSNETDAVLLLAYVTRSMCCRWGSILVFKAFCQELGPNLCVLCISSWFNCFHGEPLFSVNLRFALFNQEGAALWKSSIQFLIAKFVRKAAGCGCYRIAVRILRFDQFWFAL